MGKRDDVPSMRRRTSVGRMSNFLARIFNKNITSDASESDASLKNSHKKNEKSHLKVVKLPSSRKVLTLTIISAFLALVLVVMFIISILSPINFVESTRNFFAGVGVKGEFPTELSISSENKISKVGNDVLLLTDSNINLYTSGGGKIFSRQHGYVKPKTVTSVSRILTYDSGSTSYRIDSRSQTVLEANAENAIICAAMSDNGIYALTTYSPQFISETTVYSNEGVARFRWNSAEQHIIAVALSDNGKQVAIGSVGAKNGEYLSTVRVFNINSTEPVKTQEFVGEIILSLSYNDGSWGAVFETSYVTIFNNKDSVVQNYNEAQLKAIDLTNSQYDLITLTNYNDESHNRVLVVDSQGKIIKDINNSGGIIDCCITDDYIFILSKGVVTRIDIDSGDTETAAVSTDNVYVLPCGKNAVTVSSSYLTKSTF